MGRFKFWLENVASQRDKELRQIWGDTFKALGVGGLADEDAAQQSLSKITFGSRSPEGRSNTFKGKQAVRKRLENGQIFDRLKKSGDPELRKGIEDTRKWLDTQEPGHSANASTTVSVLLQKLFGKHYQSFIDSDMPQPDTAKAQVQPQPPKQDSEAGGPDLSQGPENPSGPANPADQQLGQQPQAPGGMQQPMPTNPLPPKPAGADMGMF